MFARRAAQSWRSVCGSERASEQGRRDEKSGSTEGGRGGGGGGGGVGGGRLSFMVAAEARRSVGKERQGGHRVVKPDRSDAPGARSPLPVQSP